jgi:hypothetical protein
VEACGGVIHIIQHRGDDPLPPLPFACFAGSPTGGTIDLLLALEGGAESGGDCYRIKLASAPTPNLGVQQRRRRLGMDERAHGIEENRANARWDQHGFFAPLLAVSRS